MDAKLMAIYRYPVKSMAGISARSALMDERGLAGDRRWMLIDAHDRFVTGRLLPQLTQVTVTEEAGGLQLAYSGEQILVPQPVSDQKLRTVRIWSDTTQSLDAGDLAADVLSAWFGRPLRLVYQAYHQRRPLSETRAGRSGAEVSFADGYPLLLLGRGSLDALNTRLTKPVSALHFRPNIVIDGAPAHAEDNWRKIRIGDATLSIVSPCSRCVFTTVDPATGNKDANLEPLATLRGYRSDPATGEVLFGVNVVPENPGARIRVDDPVVSID